jgi:hypothetical protein
LHTKAQALGTLEQLEHLIPKNEISLAAAALAMAGWRKMSPEYKKSHMLKMNEASRLTNLGRHNTPEQRARMSAAQKARQARAKAERQQ